MALTNHERKQAFSINTVQALGASNIGSPGQICNPAFLLDVAFRPGFSNYFYVSCADGSVLEILKQKKNKGLSICGRQELHSDKLVKSIFTGDH